MTDQKQVQTIKATVTRLGTAKTVHVSTKITKVHPIYKKRYTRTRSYLVHDEEGSAKVGDEVTIVSCRPISKLKHWRIA